ncbi:acyl-CoA--sterol O-acyltransferase 1-like [Rhodamnia argentea]|uniref:Acyl-CoA--sterol O-acyltransferase 1-like n=1 Tax=Rhodamnia argentea TaxID=178133 RepID=A0ABM3HXD6_9MYRT|nr:acyl-CoA--sterol O-acyltransferase 1-like [Rhodamnia argentea]
MEGEIYNFSKLCITALMSMCYCYIVGRTIPKGTQRLLAMLPVVALFLYLPLNLSTVNLSGQTGFILSWLGNSKLLLFAFGKGPLSSDPSISLPCFLAIACLPIKIQQTPLRESPQRTDSTEDQTNPPHKGHRKIKPLPQNPENTRQKAILSLNYPTKALLFLMLLHLYDYGDHFHPNVILFLYCCHIYLALELILASIQAAARVGFGMELEPQFHEPYLSSSLQDFWGKRWNLMVTNILRSTVYKPVHSAASAVVGPKWAALPAVMAAFLVSGLMHELIFFYMGCVKPTWEVTWFFVFHGACLVVEVVVKRKYGAKWRLPRALAGPMIVTFVMVTASWLFLPPLLRDGVDKKGLEEYAAAGAFIKDVSRVVMSRIS